MTETDRVFETQWFHIEAEDSPFGDGKPFYRLVAPNGVSILPVTDAGSIVYVCQYRPALKAKTLEIPAGVIDQEEDILQTGERELFEETGYRCERLLVLANESAMFANRSTQRQTLLFGANASYSADFKPSESIEVLTATVEEFSDMIQNNTFRELAGIAAYALARLRGLI